MAIVDVDDVLYMFNVLCAVFSVRIMFSINNSYGTLRLHRKIAKELIGEDGHNIDSTVMINTYT